LKPVVEPLLTEVSCGPTAPAHLFVRLLRRRGCTQMLLPCENDQAKPDRFPRLACSTLLSKILEGDPPERDPWIEAQTYAWVSPNLLRWLGLAASRTPNRFARLSKTIEDAPSCQPAFRFASRPLNHSVHGHSSSRKSARVTGEAGLENLARSAKYQRATSSARAARGSREPWLPGRAVDCSLKDSLQGSRGVLIYLT
jgi:hypothetical protein